MSRSLTQVDFSVEVGFLRIFLRTLHGVLNGLLTNESKDLITGQEFARQDSPAEGVRKNWPGIFSNPLSSERNGYRLK